MNIAIFSSLYNYDVDQVKPWVESLKKSKFGGKVFVLVYNQVSEELLNYLKSNNIFIFQSYLNLETNMATQRFLDWSEMAKKEYCDDVDLIITTDIKDIVFQTDPGLWIKQNIKDYDLVATSEGVLFRHEDWNGENLEKHFGKNMFNKLIDKETLCSGIIAGKKSTMLKLFNTIYELSFFSENPFDFIDQIFYNIAIYEIFLNKTKIVPAKDNWCANLGTLKAIPENTPEWSTRNTGSLYGYERERNISTFKDALLCKIPFLKEDLIYAENGKPYSIVHQYNRYEPWNELILKKY